MTEYERKERGGDLSSKRSLTSMCGLYTESAESERSDIYNRVCVCVCIPLLIINEIILVMAKDGQ